MVHSFQSYLKAGKSAEFVALFAIIKNPLPGMSLINADMQRTNKPDPVDIVLVGKNKKTTNVDTKTDFWFQKNKNVCWEIASQLTEEKWGKDIFSQDKRTRHLECGQCINKILDKSVELPMNERGWGIKDMDDALVMFCPFGKCASPRDLDLDIIKKYGEKCGIVGTHITKANIAAMLSMHDSLMNELNISSYKMLLFDKNKTLHFVTQNRDSLKSIGAVNKRYVTASLLINQSMFGSFVEQWDWSQDRFDMDIG